MPVLYLSTEVVFGVKKLSKSLKSIPYSAISFKPAEITWSTDPQFALILPEKIFDK